MSFRRNFAISGSKCLKYDNNAISFKIKLELGRLLHKHTMLELGSL